MKTYCQYALGGASLIGGIHLVGIYDKKFSTTRVISRVNNVIWSYKIPKIFREYFYGKYITKFNVNKEDILEPLDSFETLEKFFTRKVKPREITYKKTQILSPSDSRILSFQKVNSDEIQIIKEKKYSLCEFYTGKPNCKYTQSQIENLKKDPKNNLYSIIFYLSPGDYHRYHSPFDFKITKSIYIPGYLRPVKKSFISLFKVYEKNERIILEGESPLGNVKVGLVGALNVGSMSLKFDRKVRTGNFTRDLGAERVYEDVELGAGEEMGMFRFGSTVVLLFEAGEGFEFGVGKDDAVRYGDVVGSN